MFEFMASSYVIENGPDVKSDKKRPCKVLKHVKWEVLVLLWVKKAKEEAEFKLLFFQISSDKQFVVQEKVL
jgi:hypothetical protein